MINVGDPCAICGGEKEKILFVSHELSYTGAPTSLLRMCKVAKKLDYEPVVWSIEVGDFEKEFSKIGVKVFIVGPNPSETNDIIKKINEYSFAICNTIVTDKYVQYISKNIPVIWFIREGSGVGILCRNNKERSDVLKKFPNKYCVSEYAREILEKYSCNEVKVVHNCVEDISDYATGYVSGGGEKVKFVQLGSIEERKGYDVLLDAFLSMPTSYINKAELHFAGRIPGGRNAEFAKKIIARANESSNIYYIGEVKGDRNKAETYSNMDVVVVASRDESCSLVALEGCMFSKPLIVTENVGAKYMVDGENGKIVKTADAQSLREAMMHMIDNKERLAEMGRRSRVNYEKKASMENHVRELGEVFKDFSHRIERNIKDDGWVFPYHLFERGEKIVICGSNSMANEFKRQITSNGYVKIVGLLDDDFMQNELLSKEFDSILLAVKEKSVAIEQKKKIVNWGVKSETIKWDGDAYSWSGFLNHVYFNILESCNFTKQIGMKSFGNDSGRKEKKNLYSFVEYTDVYSRRESLPVEVDVILPIYNAYDYTEICIESVLQNTTTPYNLYLINDCSTDKRIHDLLMRIKQCSRPISLQNLFIIEHEENLGFQRSVNETINISSNHVVLLNSDTEVPRGWLERLMYPIIHDENVASVTPTTNASSMCSFPVYGRDNELIYGCSLGEIDEVFSCFPGRMSIKIPVGTGFCMALNRNALNSLGLFDPVFEKGYGEETDWCLRAEEHGWKNVWALNVFVYHKHGASFGTKLSTDRAKLIKKANEVQNKRHPDFGKKVGAYRGLAPWKNAYEWAECLLFVKANNVGKIMYFEPARALPAEEGIIIMERISKGVVLLKIFKENRWHEFSFSLIGVKQEHLERFFTVAGILSVSMESEIMDLKDNLEKIYRLIQR